MDPCCSLFLVDATNNNGIKKCPIIGEQVRDYFVMCHGTTATQSIVTPLILYFWLISQKQVQLK